MMTEMPDFDPFSRAADEVELLIYDLEPGDGIAVLIEATARTLVRCEAMPDRRFLDVLQRRTLAIATEDVSGNEAGV